MEEIFQKVREGKYNLIGFSPVRVLLGEDLWFMNRIYEESCKSGVSALFIAGGNEATFNHQILFEMMPWLDLCVIGLGEPFIEQFLNIIIE